MEDILEKRLSKLESRLGMQKQASFTNLNEELAFLRKKLSEAGFGFLLKIPADILQKIIDLATGVVFKSEPLASVSHHLLALDIAEKEINESALDVQKHHINVADLKKNFVILLEQLNYQVLEWEGIVEKLEREKQKSETKA
uniref:Uncharacterized protein n=1 Tax=Onchocerca volvulus TaxID=6282 RepID=A0A8R1TMV8_ONCVO